MKNKISLLSAAAAAAVAAMVTPAGAVTDTRTHANSAGALNLTGSWVGGIVPDSDDIALFDATMSTVTTRNIPFGATMSIGGIQVTNSAATSIALGTSGDASNPNTLTIGSLGIEMTSVAGSPLALNQRISLGASQQWSVGTGRSITTASSTILSAADPSYVLTKTGDGVINFGSGSTNYTYGHFVLNGGTVSLAQGSTVAMSASAPTSGPLGNGTLTLTSGTLASSGTAARPIAHVGTLGANGNAGVLINGNVTIGGASLPVGQIRLSGNIDLAGGTRTLTLTNGSPTATGGAGSNGQLELGMFSSGAVTSTNIFTSVANGTLAFAAGTNTSASNRAYVRFTAATPFVGNAGLTIGNNVQTTLSLANAFGTNILSVPNVTIDAGGTFDLSAQSEVIAGGARNQRIGLLSGSGTVTNAASDVVTGASASGVLTIGANSGSSTFSGVIQDGTLAAVGLNKSGASTQILTGNTNSFSLGTTVSEGTLLVNNTTGSGTGSGAVNVNSGTLGGTGVVSGQVLVGDATGSDDAFLAPGASIGDFTTTSSVTFAADGVFAVELDTTLGDLDADLLVAAGATIDSGALFSATDLGDGTGAADGTIFTVLSNTSPDQIGGVFGNLADGGSLTVNGVNYVADYQGGDGNDLTLTVVVPEPSSILALGAAGLMLAGRRRRR